MNRQVYYWCTVIVIAVAVIIGFLTVSSGDRRNMRSDISTHYETQQNGINEMMDKNALIASEGNDLIGGIS